jgi:hypothetical protein
MKIIEYDENFNKWEGNIFMGDHKYTIGYYDTWAAPSLVR